MVLLVADHSFCTSRLGKPFLIERTYGRLPSIYLSHTNLQFRIGVCAEKPVTDAAMFPRNIRLKVWWERGVGLAITAKLSR